LQETIYHKSPLGWIALVETACSLSQLKFISEPPLMFKKKTRQVAKNAMKALDLYFSNPSNPFLLPLKAEGTPFQKIIWELVANIPVGETRTYQEIAFQYGNPKAVRAVGTAIGQNPIMIFIPCHRVIGINGSLTGYAGGIEKKRWLLQHEGYPIQKTLDL